MYKLMLVEKMDCPCLSFIYHLHANNVISRYHVSLMRLGVFPHGWKPVVDGNETSLQMGF